MKVMITQTPADIKAEKDEFQEKEPRIKKRNKHHHHHKRS